ncbi:MAG: DUF1501 domain-containing protein [Blastocatellia bacterium]|nr:MAG: DUF1501 domain-containing protein [Blastocatellia bacterium]
MCNHVKRFWSRRDFLFQSGGGISGLALAYLMNEDGLLAAAADACNTPVTTGNPFAVKPPHFKPRAKAVISLFMTGGVSQVDTFDPKPALEKYAGQPLTGKGEVIVRQGFPGPLMPSPFSFKKYGESGIEVSELFPNIAKHVDEIAFLRSVYGRSNDHTQAHYEMQSGQIRSGYPAMGSWITYGLGSASSGLPGFVVLHDYRGGPIGGPQVWSSGFLPAAYQGTPFRASGDPIVDLKPVPGVTPDQQRARLDTLAKLNEMHLVQHPGSSDLAARISSYELAFRMERCAPTVVDIDSESGATKKLYGLDNEITAPFGRQCLLARRLVESGVRFVQLFHGGMGNQSYDTWDAHEGVKANHTKHAAESDLPIAGLITDLKGRGLLDSTLVIWHSEFGRMPISQRGVGRDHNPGTLTVWMTGAGVNGGQVIGASDDFGYKAEQQPISYHDLHATILHLMGIEHTKLTYRFNGRNMRLTDVYGELIPQIVET